jgi:dihydroorotate dehydrogenase electron transfer subunit
MRQFATAVTGNSELAENTYEIEFAWNSGDIPHPGEFLTIRCCDSTDPLLRRPFAFSGFNGKKGGDARASFIYLRRGKTTTLLSELAPGARIDVLGPLGRGFSLPESGASPILAAGGIGLGPILFLHQELRALGIEHRFLYGARSEPLVPVRRLPGNCVVCTDDGSLGYRGTVLSAIESGGIPPQASFYACGPGPMLKALAGKALGLGMDCQVAVEQYMACGVGACMGCAVKVADERKYARACVEGPVFQAKELVWE